MPSESNYRISKMATIAILPKWQWLDIFISFLPFCLWPFSYFPEASQKCHLFVAARLSAAASGVALTIYILSRPSAKDFTTFFRSLIDNPSYRYGLCPFVVVLNKHLYWQSPPHRGLFCDSFSGGVNFAMWSNRKDARKLWTCVDWLETL